MSSREPSDTFALIDARIEELGDWRGETLARVRGPIEQADPDVVEEWKWRGGDSAAARPARRSAPGR